MEVLFEEERINSILKAKPAAPPKAALVRALMKTPVIKSEKSAIYTLLTISLIFFGTSIVLFGLASIPSKDDIIGRASVPATFVPQAAAPSPHIPVDPPELSKPVEQFVPADEEVPPPADEPVQIEEQF